MGSGSSKEITVRRQTEADHKRKQEELKLEMEKRKQENEVKEKQKQNEHNWEMEFKKLENEEKEKVRAEQIAERKATEELKIQLELLVLAKLKMEMEVDLKKHTIDKAIDFGMKMREGSKTFEDAKIWLEEVIDVAQRQELKCQIINNKLHYFQ